MGSEVAVRSRYTELSIGTNEGLSRMERIATVMAASGAFKDAQGSAEAFAKLVIGEELGVGPYAAMGQIHLFDGKVTLGAQLIGGKIKQSGLYRYRVVESTNEVCRIAWREKLDGEWMDAGPDTEFTLQEAQTAGLLSKNNWKHYPSDMLFARALTRGARRYCSDVFSGGSVYTPEELGAENTDADGNLVVDGGSIDARPGHGVVNDIPPAETVEPEVVSAKQRAGDAIVACRKTFGEEKANEGIAALLASHFDGKKFADLTDEEYGGLADAINGLIEDREDAQQQADEPVDAEYEEITGDEDDAAGGDGHAYKVPGSRGGEYEVVVYPDGSWECSCPARKPDCKHVTGLRRPFRAPDGKDAGWLWPGDPGYDNAPPAEGDIAGKVERTLDQRDRTNTTETDHGPDGGADVDSGPLMALIEHGASLGLTEVEVMSALANAGLGTEGSMATPNGQFIARGALATAAAAKKGQVVTDD